MINLKKLFQKESIKEFSKKVFTKKKLSILAGAIVLLVGLRVGYSFMYEVNGTVTKIDDKTIQVTSFWGSKTVSLGNYSDYTNRIAVGEKVEISKNISGDVIAIRIDEKGNGRFNGTLGREQGNNDRFAQGRQGGQGRQAGLGRNNQNVNGQPQRGGQFQNGTQGQNPTRPDMNAGGGSLPGTGAPDGLSGATVKQ